MSWILWVFLELNYVSFLVTQFGHNFMQLIKNRHERIPVVDTYYQFIFMSQFRHTLSISRYYIDLLEFGPRHMITHEFKAQF